MATEQNGNEDFGWSVFGEPDLLLPVQFFATLKRQFLPYGEHRLLLAILQDAVECFQKYIHATHPKGKGLYCDAEWWISGGSSEFVFSFEHVCSVLGMEHIYFRQGLLRWRDEERRRRAARPRGSNSRATKGAVL